MKCREMRETYNDWLVWLIAGLTSTINCTTPMTPKTLHAEISTSKNCDVGKWDVKRFQKLLTSFVTHLKVTHISNIRMKIPQSRLDKVRQISLFKTKHGPFHDMISSVVVFWWLTREEDYLRSLQQQILSKVQTWNVLQFSVSLRKKGKTLI